MKSEVSYIKTQTLQRLYRDAKMSVQHCLSKEYTALISRRVQTAMDDYNRLQARKEEARHTVETLYRKLQIENPRMPDPEKGVVTAYWLGRLFGEIGPIADFKTIRRLLRYAGLNIRERSSGKYKGKNKISKKGRIMLRVILSQAIFPLLKKNALFGEYYHGKKNGKMVGAKANTAVQRKFLKMLYGWSKSGAAFDAKRLFTCESEYKGQLKLAA